MKRPMIKIMSMLLVVLMFVGILPMNVFAATAVGGYDDSNGGSSYYNVISEKEWDIAPGVKETELVLNNADGTRRQVLHTAIVDVNNPFVKVIPGTKGMWPEAGNYGTQSTSTQALEAEKLGYGNVVVATNASLSWYTEAYYKENPHLIGEPLGYSILDGQLYANSRWVEGKNSGGVVTIVVINYDYHPITGEKRPDDMPKTWIRNATDPLTGWEEQAIPVLFTYLVKPDANGNPVNQYKEDHGSGIASRTFVGVRADGTIVLAVSDGEQAPYSTGFTSYEMAEYMIKMGCVIAANCDGGGSTTFCSQRPGEELKVNCSLSDGGERPTSNTFLVISTAKADGVFARAQITADYDYYTPGSSVNFSVLGTDSVGTKVDIPADVQWKIKEDGMGTISNGVFTSNGTEGTVTAQMVYDGNVVGEKKITIVTPDTLSFDQPVVTVPYGKTATIPVKATATINGVAFEIGLGASDISFTTTNTALGSFDGLNFVAVNEADAPDDITSTVTATLNMGDNPSATVQLNLGKGSEVLWGFENGQSDIDEWTVINNRKNAEHWDYYLNLSLADRTNGQVHDGNYSMRLETNGLSSKASHSEQYAWVRLGVDGEALVLENAKRFGFWLYVPEDNIQCWVQLHYKTDSNGDGVFDTDNVVSIMESENVYYNIDESGWHYLSADISSFEKIKLAADKQFDKDPSDGMTGAKGEFFLAIVFHKGINNMLWQTNGSINGNYTYYLDNFTVDYSDAVEDRENPVFDKIYLDGTTALIKRDVVETENNVLNLSAAVADQSIILDANKNEVPLYNATGLNASTAKVYIDGVEVKSTFANGVLSATGIKVADGYHRVKFEICDNAGNKSVVIRVVKVNSGSTASTLKLVPADATLDRIPFGSIYWMNLEATAIETIQSVETVIDLNNVNHWQLDYMELAEGFTASYTIAEETNTATITITRTGTNYDSGAAVLAKLPVRILYFDTDIKTPGYTAETYWTSYPFWAQDMKMDVDMGLITFTNGTTGTFSNEEFHVDTEMYTIMAGMDKAYFTEHGTTHVHTPVAIEDKAATCSEYGYTGRTFCYGCNSPVEWGTIIPATGHTFEISGDKLSCACGTESTATGLISYEGKNYYAVNGKLTGGWITVDDEWYCFDTKTFAGLDGEHYNEQAVLFRYDNGRLISGSWAKTKTGTRYWYGPGYYRDMSPELSSARPYEIDGKTYLFDRNGYMKTGIARFYSG
ncbi:MAG: phosphodiester glycosidase family protein, partial [Clostridia bacterium]|nr:phosphodiester glycosidase family protein [Clostridia bacterium]